MTIEDAIEYLNMMKANSLLCKPNFKQDALQLGVEALKRVKGNRIYPQPTVKPLLLPSETIAKSEIEQEMRGIRRAEPGDIVCRFMRENKGGD